MAWLGFVSIVGGWYNIYIYLWSIRWCFDLCIYWVVIKLGYLVFVIIDFYYFFKGKYINMCLILNVVFDLINVVRGY